MSVTREAMRTNRSVTAMSAVVKIAQRQGEPPQPVDGALVALELTENRRGLESVFKQLVSGGVLIGKRGARGGYLLARPPGEITLCDVDRAVDPTDIEAPPELAYPLGLAAQACRRILGQWSIAAVNARCIGSPNPHHGSSLEDFLESEGILEGVTEHAIARVDAYISETEVK